MRKTTKTLMQPARSRDSNLGPNYQCSASLPLGRWWAIRKSL
ncbi:hypothetical protein X975_11626, partial [Stegodyphus mimosarum]